MSIVSQSNSIRHQIALEAYKAKNYEKAMTIWHDEALNNSPQAMANIGIMYLRGEGVVKDIHTATKWFEDSAKYNNPSANFNLGIIYEHGLGTTKDINKSIHHYEASAALGHTLSKYNLAMIYIEQADYKNAFTQMVSAAREGSMEATARIFGFGNIPKITHDPKVSKFKLLDLAEKLAKVDETLTLYIRPILLKDGGNIEVVDFIEHKDKDEIRLRYMGTCNGCSLAGTGTFLYVDEALRRNIDYPLDIFVL